MPPVKPAVDAATAFLLDLIADASAVRFEEVEPSADGLFVTLSFLQPPEGPLAQLQYLSPRRTFKRFEVVEGEVRSMTIREFESA